MEELRRRAKETLLVREIAEQERFSPEDDLLTMEGMDEETARLFSSKGIRTMEELAAHATDELDELTGIEEERASRLIMTAREPWFSEA